MFESKRGVYGAPFGGRGVDSPFLVHPPPPMDEGVLVRLGGSIFLGYEDERFLWSPAWSCFLGCWEDACGWLMVRSGFMDESKRLVFKDS